MTTWYVLNTAAASPGFFGQLQENGSGPADAAASFGYAPGKLASGSFGQSRLGASATGATTSAFCGDFEEFAPSGSLVAIT